MQHQWVSLGLLCVGACNPHNVYTHRCHGRRRRRRSTTRFSCLHTHIIHMHTCRAVGSTVRFRCSSVFETVISVSRVASTEQHSGLSVCSQSTNKKLHLSHFGRHFVDWRCHQNIPQQRNSCSLLRISKFIFRTVSNIPSTSVVAVDIYNARTQKVQSRCCRCGLANWFYFCSVLICWSSINKWSKYSITHWSFRECLEDRPYRRLRQQEKWLAR